MPMNITFREAEPSDAGKFLEYCKTVGAESNNLTFGAEGIPFSISQEADFIRKYSGNPDSIMLVAFDEGELVGTGAESVELEVRSDNERAIALYKKFGFEKVGRNEKFFKINGEFFAADYMNLYL